MNPQDERIISGHLVWEQRGLVIECPTREERDRITHYLEESEVIVRVVAGAAPSEVGAQDAPPSAVGEPGAPASAGLE